MKEKGKKAAAAVFANNQNKTEFKQGWNGGKRLASSGTASMSQVRGRRGEERNPVRAWKPESWEKRGSCQSKRRAHLPKHGPARGKSLSEGNSV